MAEEMTLLAHLVPKITSRVEDTATDALAFILNKSGACRDALNHLLQEHEFDLEPIVRFETQVTYEDGSRPDMNGLDKNGKKRLLVESKFWHSLTKGQASEYFDQLDEEGPGMLLFIAPDGRLPTLWSEIKRQMSEAEKELEELSTRPHRCRIADSEKGLMLVSWTSLLDHLAAAVPGDAQISSDIRQLRGLAQREDDEAFLPIHPQELAPSLARRIRGLNDLIDHVVRKGREEKWITTENRNRQAQKEGYGRYFRFFDGSKPIPGDFFLGLNLYQWANNADTPLWLWVSSGVGASVSKLRELNINIVEQGNQGALDVPIYLRTGEERQPVLEDAANQVKKVLLSCRDAS